MKRLWVKLVGTIALIMVLGSGAIYISVQLFTRHQYQAMVREGDLLAAERLAELFSEYYARTGSWEGVESALDSLFMQLNSPMMGMMQGGRMGPGMQRFNRNRENLPPSRFPLLASRFVITSPDGAVIFDSINELEGSFRPPEHISKGAPIIHEGSAAGYLFVGTMIEPALQPVDRAFLSAVNKAVLFTTIGVVFAALIAGSFLVFHITSPVKRLSSASSKVAAGDFSVRVDTARKDEIGNLSRRFNSMAESLEKAAESRKQMISDSAHELRTPVSLIQGKLEMILEGVYSPDREHLQDILGETRILSRLIGELQDLADADAGVLTLAKEDLDLGELIGQAVSMYQTKTAGTGIRLEIGGDRGLTIFADRQKLYQVLTNLLSNSLRHTPAGGTIRLEAHAFTAGGKPEAVRISVYNSGPQIPEDKLGAVFERFYRLDSARNREHGGKGLGLAISKAIIEAHGGQIWAKNVPAGGVRFTVELPGHSS